MTLDDSWGLDHGTWSVLRHVYPAGRYSGRSAQHRRDQARRHFISRSARRLAPLRDEGVLIVGSGNLVHNLHAYAWGRHARDPYDWAVRFERRGESMMLAGDLKPLVDYETLGPDARAFDSDPRSLSAAALRAWRRQQGERIRFPVEGVDGGSISMLAVQIG